MTLSRVLYTALTLSMDLFMIVPLPRKFLTGNSFQRFQLAYIRYNNYYLEIKDVLVAFLSHIVVVQVICSKFSLIN